MENKPIAIVIDEAKQAIAKAVNETGLPPCLLEPILGELYREIVQLKANELAAAKEAAKESE